MRNREQVLRTRVELPLSVDEVFEFFSAAENLQRITPPELGFSIRTPLPVEMRQGAHIEYRLSLFGLGFTWLTEITEWDPPHSFVDTQLKGPYAQWIHRHSFTPVNGGTLMEDEVRYRLPVPVLGMAGLPVVKLQLRRIFSYRERRIRELLLSGSGS